MSVACGTEMNCGVGKGDVGYADRVENSGIDDCNA